MSQQNMMIAGGILVAMGILAVGFNKLIPDTYQENTSLIDRLRSTTLGWKNTYPSDQDPRKSGGTRCKSRHTRKK